MLVAILPDISQQIICIHFVPSKKYASEFIFNFTKHYYYFLTYLYLVSTPKRFRVQTASPNGKKNCVRLFLFKYDTKFADFEN